MANNYVPSTTPGVKYMRPAHIQLTIPRSGSVEVTIQEDLTVPASDGSFVEQPISTVHLTVTNGALSVPLVNPADNTLTGSSTTLSQIYQALYSAYLTLAAMRDAGTL